MHECPFEIHHELYKGLEPAILQAVQRRNDSNQVPGQSYLPGCPRIRLSDVNIGEYLCEELQTTELDDMEPYLWLVAKQDSTHISSLTDQIVRGRNIIVTEQPRLHLVWAYNRIFIKPLPPYLLSRAFWDHYLLSNSSPIKLSVRQDLQRAANGLLRSYFYLVQHESDFAIAQDEKARLIPKGISYEDFSMFTNIVKDGLADHHLSRRYYYGQLRLTRLNLWYKILFLGFNYHRMEWQYSAYMAHYYAPILFVFAAFGVTLAAMQVILASEAFDDTSDTSATPAYRFAKFTLSIILAVASFLFAMMMALFFRELTFALNDLARRKRAKDSMQRVQRG